MGEPNGMYVTIHALLKKYVEERLE